MNDYANYRLAFEKDQHQPSDSYWSDPAWSVAVGAYAPYAMRVPVQAWTEAVVQRPEMW